MALIAQVVGRNEANRFAKEVAEHMATYVDTIVYTDDASDDETPDIFADVGAKVYRNEKQMFNVHEGMLRQGAWSNLEKHAKRGDWVLAIDCDEKLYTAAPSITVADLINAPKWDVLNIDFCHMWNETHYRVDKAWGPHGSTRLFKYYPNGKFRGRAMACGSEPTYVQELIRRKRYCRNTGLVMMHMGYIRDEDKIAKHERYMTLDGGDFHAMAHIKSIIDPTPTLVEWTFG